MWAELEHLVSFMAMANPEPAQNDAPRHLLEYHIPEKSSARLWPIFARWFDWLSILLVFGFALACVDACQINLMEAPMNGGGSSYIDSAPCNEQWQKEHPEFTRFILSLPHHLLELFALPMLLLYIFTAFTLPYLLLGWLAYRAWTHRRFSVQRIIILIPLILLIAMLPWLHKCMMVIAD